MTLWVLCQAALLVTNGLAVLNNDRCLEKWGLGYSQIGRAADGLHPGPSLMRKQVVEFLHAVTYLRVPLIVVNILVILVKLVFG